MSRKPVTAWSYSRWALMQQCPFKFEKEVIEGIRPPHEPNRGDRIHAEAAAYIMTPEAVEIDAPMEIEVHFGDLIRALRALPRKIAELELTFTRAFRKTGWMSKDAWWRNKLDVMALYHDNTGDIVDWKSGKEHELEHREQLENYGLAGLLGFPQLESVRARMSYIDSGAESVMEFTRADIGPLKEKWVPRAESLETATHFPPKPGYYCKWCHLRHSIGGACKFG